MKENRFMDAISQGVYVIGVIDQEKVNFMTAAWITQISGNPNKVLLAIGKTHYTAEMIHNAGKFSINVLRKNQKSLAKQCGFVSGRNKDKSENVDYEVRNGVPIIKDTAAYLECRATREIEEGDHILFIANVIDGEQFEEEHLIYKAKEYF